MFLARDRCGQKPLYYFDHGGRFLFASEVKAMLESAHVEARVNTRAIDPFLTLRNVPEPHTMFAGIEKLPVSHYLRRGADGNDRNQALLGNRIARRRHRRLQKDDEYLEEFEALFSDAVQPVHAQGCAGRRVPERREWIHR